MSLPRLHPEDLQVLIDAISSNIRYVIEEVFAKKETVSEMQTLTVKDVARILNQHPTTILRYINRPSQLIKATKIGKDWIITQQSLTNFIDGK